LYKLQLDNAQKEIFRAQDIINQVSAQKSEAEADAARARTKARKLIEENMVMIAHEEGMRSASTKEGRGRLDMAQVRRVESLSVASCLMEKGKKRKKSQYTLNVVMCSCGRGCPLNNNSM